MTTVELRSEIKQLLSREKNASVLEAIRMLLRREEDTADEDLTDEEVSDLGSLRAERKRGEGSSHTWEEVQQMAQEMIRK